MSALHALAVAALCGTLIAGESVSAATAPGPSYTSDQAAHGRLMFYQHCAECHGGDAGGHIGPALAGPDSKLAWESGQYVYTYMTAAMPNGNAGTLSDTEYLDIMAFLYEQHHHSAGRKPLDKKAAMADAAPMGW